MANQAPPGAITALYETLHVRQQGQKVAIKINNQLYSPTTVHWHGLAATGDADGSPHVEIAPGQSWSTQFTLEQATATCWYHPHSHSQTGYQVAMGLAGLFIIDDEQSDQLPLPTIFAIVAPPVPTCFSSPIPMKLASLAS